MNQIYKYVTQDISMKNVNELMRSIISNFTNRADIIFRIIFLHYLYFLIQYKLFFVILSQSFVYFYGFYPISLMDDLRFSTELNQYLEIKYIVTKIITV